MKNFVSIHCCLAAMLVTGGLCLFSSRTHAGGFGHNVIVVVNQSSSNSCALGNYYREQRNIPPENVLRVNWPIPADSWSSGDFANTLFNPLLALCETRGLTNQIDFVVLSSDLPYRIGDEISGWNSTTAALFYGVKTNTTPGNPEPGITNSYGRSEAAFRWRPPASAKARSFLATMLTAANPADARRLVDQGIHGDATFPNRPVILAKSSDYTRNLRFKSFDNAILNTLISGHTVIFRTNTDAISGETNLFGYQNGMSQFSLNTNTFIPGAIADNLTSFGGIITGANDQTNLLAFVTAGAAGTYGTVAEPGGDGNDFPDPLVYFYQTRGFPNAEAYYQSIETPYLGLVIGDPLAAPFVKRGSGKWQSAVTNQVVAGSTNLKINFSAADSSAPLQRVDLFVDGKFHVTLTNIFPATAEALSARINGYPISCLVDTNTTLLDLAQGLSTAINHPSVTNATKVRAIPYGDRVELQSLVDNYEALPYFLANPATTNTTYRVQNLSESVPPGMTALPNEPFANFGLRLEIPSALPYVIQASTNLTTWEPIWTNTAAGLVTFHDETAPSLPRRFYRVRGPVPNQPPQLAAASLTRTQIQIYAESQLGQPLAILSSSNGVDWSVAATNLAGGFLTLTASNVLAESQRFYRSALLPVAGPSLLTSNLNSTTTLLRVNSAIRPYTIQSTTNGTDWSVLTTNFAFRQIQLETQSGGTNSLAHLQASQPIFLSSPAHGYEDFRLFASTLAAGTWIGFKITKTNDVKVTIAVTNQIAGTTSQQLAAQLATAINSAPALQDSGGVSCDDFIADAFLARFSLRARSPGLLAAQTTVTAISSGITIMPPIPRTLTRNIADLQLRNHLYVSVGVPTLDLAFPFDTTQFADGHHELTAVAYEGTSVRTPTPTTLPVIISNTPLAASLQLLDLTNNAPVNGVYQCQVLANTNTIAQTTLYSTGGAIGVAANSALANFTISGTNLGAGLHPFYATIETSDGKKYRTAPQWIRLR